MKGRSACERDADFGSFLALQIQIQGFDEEAGGVHGATTLAKRLEEIYGKDSLAMIVDEGNPVLSKSNPLGFG